MITLLSKRRGLYTHGIYVDGEFTGRYHFDIGGFSNRSKYTPHQGTREMQRRAMPPTVKRAKE